MITNAGSTRTVAESATAGTAVTGPALRATDVDTGDVIQFGFVSVVPAAAMQVLSIDPFSGVISVARDSLPIFNFECDREEPVFGCPQVHRAFFVTVSATDSGAGNLTAIATLVVNVTDVSEAPVVPSRRLYMTIPELSAPDSPLQWDSAYHQDGFVPDFYDEKRSPLTFELVADVSQVALQSEQAAISAEFRSSFAVRAENATTSELGVEGTIGGSTPSGTFSSSERSLIRNPPLQTPRFYLASTVPTDLPASLATGYSEDPGDPGVRSRALLDYEHRNEYAATLQVTDSEAN